MMATTLHFPENLDTEEELEYDGVSGDDVSVLSEDEFDNGFENDKEFALQQPDGALQELTEFEIDWLYSGAFCGCDFQAARERGLEYHGPILSNAESREARRPVSTERLIGECLCTPENLKVDCTVCILKGRFRSAMRGRHRDRNDISIMRAKVVELETDLAIKDEALAVKDCELQTQDDELNMSRAAVHNHIRGLDMLLRVIEKEKSQLGQGVYHLLQHHIHELRRDLKSDSTTIQSEDDGLEANNSAPAPTTLVPTAEDENLYQRELETSNHDSLFNDKKPKVNSDDASDTESDIQGRKTKSRKARNSRYSPDDGLERKKRRRDEEDTDDEDFVQAKKPRSSIGANRSTKDGEFSDVKSTSRQSITSMNALLDAGFSPTIPEDESSAAFLKIKGSKGAKTTKQSSNANNNRKSGWTDVEKECIIKIVRHQVEEQEKGKRLAIYDTSLWNYVSREFRSQNAGKSISPNALRMLWARELRAKSGVDERKVKSSTMTTSIQRK